MRKVTAALTGLALIAAATQALGHPTGQTSKPSNYFEQQRLSGS